MMVKYPVLTVSDTSRPFHLHIFFLVPLIRISEVSESAKAYTTNICANEKPRGISVCVHHSCWVFSQFPAMNVLINARIDTLLQIHRNALFRDSSLWGCVFEIFAWLEIADGGEPEPARRSW
jgi:hypothetical protein